ncbi:MAG: FixH family protein [Fluviicola sp.]|nr:FixH family protein [Fluviicola sp.]
MNWGKGIALALALFIGFIMYMVVTMMSTKIDLVSEDYYQKEINYSSELDAVKRDNQLKARPTFIETENHYVVQLSSVIELKNVELFLRRPNDDREDKTFSIRGTKNFMIAKDELKKGNYHAILSYDFEGELHIQKHEIKVK